MQAISQFYEALTTVLMKDSVSFYADLTGVTVEATLKPPAFDSIQSLLESDVYAKMLEEISTSDTEQAVYLRKQMATHEKYYVYEAQEAECESKVDVFKLRRSYLEKNGAGILFLPDNENALSIASYSSIVSRQLELLNPLPNSESSENRGDSIETYRNEIMQMLHAFGLSVESITFNEIAPEHQFKGGYAIGLPLKDSWHNYIAYSSFPNFWLNLYVLSHELGHATYYQLIHTESADIQLERPDFWNECIAETIAIYCAKLCSNRHPELMQQNVLRTKDALEFTQRTLYVLMKESIEEADIVDLDEALEAFTYTLYEPFRYYVATELANRLVERGHEWFIDMIKNTHGFALDRLILDYWESYCKKYSSE